MQATINDICRGDRFTWSGRTWIAAADAHPNLGGIHGAVDMVALPGSMKADEDGVVRQQNPSQLTVKAIHFSAPVTILERGIQVSLTYEDAPIVQRKRPAVESALMLLDRQTKMRKALEDDLTETDRQFNDLVRLSLANGASVARLVETTGLSRARIYQIRDGRR
ncbi:hypothetical protein [Streptomyces sp. NPDC085596]|uniref:hypothetical protein n=1 Tax=Streptomyces sp. NPDC085596 TaxID=3365731 RepID=UPI0037CDE519